MPNGIVILCASAAIGVGCFLPWVKATAPFVGTLTVTGMDAGKDGLWVLVLTTVLGAAGWRVSTRGEHGRWVAVLCGLAIGGIAVADMIDAQDRIDAARAEAGDFLVASIGAGLVLVGAATAAALVAAVFTPSPFGRSTNGRGYLGLTRRPRRPAAKANHKLDDWGFERRGRQG